MKDKLIHIEIGKLKISNELNERNGNGKDENEKEESKLCITLMSKLFCPK